MFWLIRQWLVHHLFSGGTVNSAWHLRAPPHSRSASYFKHAALPRIPTPLSISITLSLTLFPSSPSIHLLSKPLSGAWSCCVRGILGLWRQFGNEARLHLNTLLSGHLVNLMRGGWGEWREGGGGEQGEVKREREGESKGSNCNTERGVEERERDGSEGGSVWRTVANINSLCKSAAQTNWQAGITPERSWIKSMKALAPLTLDLQPRPVHRSVPVMHTNDSGGAGPNRNIATRFGFLQW